MSEAESHVQALDASREWAREIAQALPIELFLFGSLIYQDGEQFDPQKSDLDFIALLTGSKTALERASILLELKKFKSEFELKLIPLLQRTNCSDAAISLVPVTELEIEANVHKSDARQFFDYNSFRHLISNQEEFGFKWSNIRVNSRRVSEPVRQALEFIQKNRNLFLSVSANGSGGIGSFDGDDPIPKSLARVAALVAAQAKNSSDERSRYDIRIGLEYIHDLVSKANEKAGSKEDLKRIQDLQKKFSVRRLGRGKRAPLTDFDQLVLGEILYDDVASFPSEPNRNWAIKIEGINRTKRKEYESLLRQLRALIPEAEIISSEDGSILLRMRGSQSSYQVLSLLKDLGVLAKYFGVEDFQLSEILDPDDKSPFAVSEASTSTVSESGVTETELSLEVISYLKRWRPSESVPPQSLDRELLEWLSKTLPSQINNALHIEADIKRIDRNARFIFDLAITFVNTGNQVFIELLRLKNRNYFFRKIERIRDFHGSMILLVVSDSETLKSLQSTFGKTQEIYTNIKILPIEIGEEAVETRRQDVNKNNIPFEEILDE